MRDARLIADLEQIVGVDHVLVDPALRAGFEIDWTGRYRGEALAVVRPADADQVAAVLRACAVNRVGVVPQGGNTGLVGGAVPRPGTILLSLTRLDDLGVVDDLAGEVTAGAGVTLAALATHVGAAGFAFPLDLAARDSATVGGMVATNAGGVHAFRHGSMRDRLTGIEAVLADASIVRRLDRPRKDNTGYPLHALLAGSEGTLAVITAARLRLGVPLDHRAVALIALPDVAAVVRTAAALRRSLPTLEAAELLLANGLDLVVRHSGAAPPFPVAHPAYLLVEAADQVEAASALVDRLADGPDVLDAVVADDGPARARLWALREGIADAIALEGIPHKVDVALPVRRVATFADRVAERVAAISPRARMVVFGHVLDGNLHVNVLGPASDDQAVDDAVLRLTLELGGSISAEHGIGMAKVRWLAEDRRPGDLAAMRAIKRALDPAGILNPGVLLG